MSRLSSRVRKILANFSNEGFNVDVLLNNAISHLESKILLERLEEPDSKDLRKQQKLNVTILTNKHKCLLNIREEYIAEQSKGKGRAK